MMRTMRLLGTHHKKMRPCMEGGIRAGFEAAHATAEGTHASLSKEGLWLWMSKETNVLQ